MKKFYVIELEDEEVFFWEKEECVPFSPIIHPFDESSSGIKENIEGTELDFFKYFVNDDMINVMVAETNRHYKYVTKDSTSSNRLKSWVDVDADEMYFFLGVFILFSVTLFTDLFRDNSEE